jgi:magnesium chelatase family protein
LEEALEATKIHSIAGTLPAGQPLLCQRPFRSPHHTISDAGMIGGGAIPRPGEISLSHHGVLFLDELPELERNVLEALRQPMEDGVVTISRAAANVSYPANFMLAASMNPCPCGFFGSPTRPCTCSLQQVARYRQRVSGPVLDRIDIHLEVPAVPFDMLSKEVSGEPSAEIRKRVAKARQVQGQRYKGNKGIYTNSQLSGKLLHKFCPLDEECKRLLARAVDKLGLSARAYDRITKLARTIADLAGEENITTQHISEAIQYRALDREL